MEGVTLEQVTPGNLGAVLRLGVKMEQRRLVAENAKSLAEAYVYPDRAWPRVICVEGRPVGFVMLDLVGPDHPEAPDGRASYFLWRLMIGAEHQGKGFGRAAMLAVIEHVRGLPDARWLDTSYVPGVHGPAGFYAGLGFVPTGEVDDGEIVTRLRFGEIASG
ncbi:MAG: GNAT family N-acetyltransferase [Planctomycetota bacterium]